MHDRCMHEAWDEKRNARSDAQKARWAKKNGTFQSEILRNAVGVYVETTPYDFTESTFIRTLTSDQWDTIQSIVSNAVTSAFEDFHGVDEVGEGVELV